MTKQRIQKELAAAGVASRRAIEEMVLEGRVTVNGEPVTDLPCFVDLASDDVRVDGRAVRRRAKKKVYFLVNKPKGVLCTKQDPQGRPRVVDMIPEIPQRVYSVGRLDKDSTGLVLMTNDGELCERLTHPRYEVPKTYVVEIDGRLSGEEIEALKKGMYLDGKKTQGVQVKVLRRGRKESLLEVRLREGRNREIRRILARLGYKVRKLKRVAIGPIRDTGLKVGSFRHLGRGEVRKLWRAAGVTGKKERGKDKGAEPGT